MCQPTSKFRSSTVLVSFVFFALTFKCQKKSLSLLWLMSGRARVTGPSMGGEHPPSSWAQRPISGSRRCKLQPILSPTHFHLHLSKFILLHFFMAMCVFAARSTVNLLFSLFAFSMTLYSSWTWSTSWTVDKSNSFGPHDLEGWYYGPNFERLSELIQKRSGADVSTKTSTVRRRRWVRTMTCSSKEVLDQIALRVEKVNISRKNIELAISEKQNSLQSIMFYEENRAFVFDQSLSLATQGTTATLAVLKDLFFKLKRLHEVSLFLSILFCVIVPCRCVLWTVPI